jgi:CheY-like chemotaxis protein
MRPRMLIVDDQEEYRKKAKDFYNKFGFDVITKSENDDILEFLRNNSIDCIQMDIVFKKVREGDDVSIDIKDEDGLYIIKQILEEFEGIQIVVVSAYISPNAREKAEILGIKEKIYSWYSKNHEFRLIALNTIKALNKSYFERQKRYFLDHIIEIGNKEEIIVNALETCPPLLGPINYETAYIIDTLKDIFEKIDTARFKENEDMEYEYSNYFCEVVLNHLEDFYYGTGQPLESLVDDLVYFIKRSNLHNLDDNLLNAIKMVIDGLSNKDITEREVFKVKKVLEKASGITLGIILDEKDDSELDEYLNLTQNTREEK